MLYSKVNSKSPLFQSLLTMCQLMRSGKISSSIRILLNLFSNQASTSSRSMNSQSSMPWKSRRSLRIFSWINSTKTATSSWPFLLTKTLDIYTMVPSSRRQRSSQVKLNRVRSFRNSFRTSEITNCRHT